MREAETRCEEGGVLRDAVPDAGQAWAQEMELFRVCDKVSYGYDDLRFEWGDSEFHVQANGRDQFPPE